MTGAVRRAPPPESAEPTPSSPRAGQTRRRRGSFADSMEQKEERTRREIEAKREAQDAQATSPTARKPELSGAQEKSRREAVEKGLRKRAWKEEAQAAEDEQRAAEVAAAKEKEAQREMREKVRAERKRDELAQAAKERGGSGHDKDALRRRREEEEAAVEQAEAERVAADAAARRKRNEAVVGSRKGGALGEKTAAQARREAETMERRQQLEAAPATVKRARPKGSKVSYAHSVQCWTSADSTANALEVYLEPHTRGPQPRRERGMPLTCPGPACR